jgi:hypothetical protein
MLVILALEMSDRGVNVGKPRKDLPLPDGGARGGTSGHFVSPDATMAELEMKASDCEGRAANAEGPLASQLREEAKLYREWIAALRSGRWTS